MNTVFSNIKMLTEKVKTWKDFWITAAMFSLILIFNYVSKIDIDNFISNSKEEIEQEIIQQHDNLMSETIDTGPKIDSIINSTLDNINLRYHFNKSVIFVYHNNVTLTNSIPFIRMSMSHERILENKFKINPEINLMQNIPASVFSGLNSQLYKNDYICIDISNLKNNDLNAYLRLSEMNVTGYVAVLIRNDNNVPLATLICYTCDRKIECNLEVKQTLTTQALFIKELFKYSKYGQ